MPAITNYSENVHIPNDLFNITFDGKFGPIEIFDWHGIWRAIWIIILAISAIITLVVNVIPIHFITIQPSPKRPIDVILLYDQVRYTTNIWILFITQKSGIHLELEIFLCKSVRISKSPKMFLGIYECTQVLLCIIESI